MAPEIADIIAGARRADRRAQLRRRTRRISIARKFPIDVTCGPREQRLASHSVLRPRP